MHKKIFAFSSLFLSLFLLLIIIAVTYLPKKNAAINSRAAAHDTGGTSLEAYCQDGYYKIPGEIICSRAPGCGGFTYDQVNTVGKMPDKSCLDNGVIAGNPKTAACDGYPPACCYEMARTGDFTKCVGYWERLWCSVDLCEKAVQNGASDDQCGGCLCGHAYEYYCPQRGGIKPAVPIETRLGFAAPTPTSIISTPTPIPQSPTATPTPLSEVTGSLSEPTPTSPPKNGFTIPTRENIVATEPPVQSSSVPFHFQLPAFPSLPSQKIKETVSPALDLVTYAFYKITYYDHIMEYTINTTLERLNPFK